MIKRLVLRTPGTPAASCPDADVTAPGDIDRAAAPVATDRPPGVDDTEQPAVGYKQPPAQSRFTKGTSGNAKGRPRGSRSFKTELREVLAMKIPVTENGKKSKVSARHAMLLRLRQKALSGDQRAIESLLRLVTSHLPDEAPGDAADTAQADAEMLDELLADLRPTINGDDDE